MFINIPSEIIQKLLVGYKAHTGNLFLEGPRGIFPGLKGCFPP